MDELFILSGYLKFDGKFHTIVSDSMITALNYCRYNFSIWQIKRNSDTIIIAQTKKRL